MCVMPYRLCRKYRHDVDSVLSIPSGHKRVLVTETSVSDEERHLYMQTNEIRNCGGHYRRAADTTITEMERTATGGAGLGTFKPISGQDETDVVRPFRISHPGGRGQDPDRSFSVR